MSLLDVLQIAFFSIGLLFIILTVLAVAKNVRGGRKGKYRFTYFERKNHLPQ